MKFKLKQKIIFIAVVSMILSIFFKMSVNAPQYVADGMLRRPEPNETSTELILDVYDEEGRFQTSIEAFVEPQKISGEVVGEYFDRAYEEISRSVLGQNESFEEVQEKLHFIDTALNGMIQVEWYSGNYELIDYDGSIHNSELEAEQSEIVAVRYVMTYEDYSREGVFEFTIRAPKLSGQEEAAHIIDRRVKEAIGSNREDEMIILPDEVNNSKLVYQYHQENTPPLLFVGLGAAAAAVLVVNEKNKKRQEAHRRKTEMIYDYAEVVSKLTLLMGAGMTVRRAWGRIAQDYMKQREKNGTKRYIYEEIVETECNMKAGISESAAYERFGRRCDIKEYLKLASLLQTNLKKGTRELTGLLQQESLEAFELRKNVAKQRGEEATTKLLVPMVIMLAVVMIIVMAPAVMSFQV